MIRTIFIVAIFSFVVVVFETNVFEHSDGVKERQQESGLIQTVTTIAVANMTDKMKYICLKMDANGEIGQMEDKEQKEQCKKFLNRVSIFEIKELINKYMEKK